MGTASVYTEQLPRPYCIIDVNNILYYYFVSQRIVFYPFLQIRKICKQTYVETHKRCQGVKFSFHNKFDA